MTQELDEKALSHIQHMYSCNDTIYSTCIWPPLDLDLTDNSSVDKDDNSEGDLGLCDCLGTHSEAPNSISISSLL